MKNLFLTSRLFYLCGALIAIFALSFHFTGLFVMAQIAIVVLVVIIGVDVVLLFFRGGAIRYKRSMAKTFSLNDENEVSIELVSSFRFPVHVDIIDEVPYQFQMRDFIIRGRLQYQSAKHFKYILVPKTRGLYVFDNTNVCISSPLRLIQRRVVFEQKQEVKVFPSIKQMKKYQLQISASVKLNEGIRKLQRIGHSYEFDHIKSYTIGQDPRCINWKASGRRNELMVNHFTDEKSQQVYCILNKSRLMNMPFNGLSLLDYAINSTLTISNIVLNKSDKIGLLSYSDKIGSVIQANRGNRQLQNIQNALYNEKESVLDPNYELLYSAVRYFVQGRSLLFLFTNFETLDSLKRNLNILRRLNHFHLLVPIIFKNTELEEFVENRDVKTDLDIYNKIIARKVNNEKELICTELRNHGIQYILTTPEDLSINTINKYLELKSRGLI